MGPHNGARRGKVLFIVIDQLRADCVTGALGQVVELPHIRALMAGGVTFRNHFTVTNPCGPARASLLTGLYAMNHRSVRNGTPLARHHTNLALEARKAGYEPLLFGYTDTSADPAGRHPADPELRTYEGLLPGFTELVQLRFDTSYPWVADLKAKGYTLPPAYLDLFRATGGRLDGPTLYRAEDSDTAFLTDETVKALSVREDQDWFAHVTYIRPHPPLAAPAPYNRMYAPGDVPAANCRESVADERAVHPVLDAFFAEPAMRNLHIGFDGRMDRMDEADRQALRAVYLGLAAEVDHHIGRLVAYLKETGQYGDTLIVVTADHGEMLGDHCMWGKESPFDQAYHVPLIIRDPRRRAAAGQVVEALTESIDVAPTILEWLGAEPPVVFDGCSLVPFLEGSDPTAWRGHVFLELDLGDPVKPTRYERLLGIGLDQANLAVLRERRFKYIHFNGGLPPLLFDLQNDPGEMRDLAGDPAYAPELARLASRMLDHRMTHASHAASHLHLTGEGVKQSARNRLAGAGGRVA